MPRLFRLALMFLLAIALPLQGAAAATMISCGTGHEHRLAPVASHDGDSIAAAGHDHASDHASNQGANHSPVSHSHEGKSDLSKGTFHKCSACASCCVGAAIPSHVTVFAAVKLTDQPAPLVARSVAAYVTEGLERPPRAILA